MRTRRIALAVVAALAGLGIHAAGAGAVTFGADLSAPANNSAACASSCMYFSGAPGPTFYAPAGGTVTAVRVKTGGVGGPMQIVVLASLYQNHAGDPGHPYFACCFVERYGPTFTANANGVTTVPTSLPVVEQPTPPPDDFTTNARGDFLALSVGPNVPVPANLDNASLFEGFIPAPTPQTVPAPSSNPIFYNAGGFGAHLMMNADLSVGGGGTGGGGGGTGGGAVGGGGNTGGGGAIRPLTIANGGQLLGSTASIPLTCVLTSACDGTLRLTDRTTGLRAATARARKPTVYGSTRFSIRAGKTRSIKVRLNAAGRRKLGRRSSLTLTATATLGSRTVSIRVKLKRPRPHR